MKFEVGKLYKCPDYFLMIYPSKEKASSVLGRRTVVVGSAEEAAAHWSDQLNCQVRYSEPGEIFIFLGRDREFLNVLFGEKQGWIIFSLQADFRPA